MASVPTPIPPPSVLDRVRSIQRWIDSLLMSDEPTPTATPTPTPLPAQVRSSSPLNQPLEYGNVLDEGFAQMAVEKERQRREKLSKILPAGDQLNALKP